MQIKQQNLHRSKSMSKSNSVQRMNICKRRWRSLDELSGTTVSEEENYDLNQQLFSSDSMTSLAFRNLWSPEASISSTSSDIFDKDFDLETQLNLSKNALARSLFNRNFIYYQYNYLNF